MLFTSLFFGLLLLGSALLVEVQVVFLAKGFSGATMRVNACGAGLPVGSFVASHVSMHVGNAAVVYTDEIHIVGAWCLSLRD